MKASSWSAASETSACAASAWLAGTATTMVSVETMRLITLPSPSAGGRTKAASIAPALKALSNRLVRLSSRPKTTWGQPVRNRLKIEVTTGLKPAEPVNPTRSVPVSPRPAERAIDIAWLALSSMARASARNRMPCLGQGDPASDACEKVNAEFALQSLDLLRERRLGDPQANSCLRDVELLGRGDEIAEMPQLHDQPMLTPWVTLGMSLAGGASGSSSIGQAGRQHARRQPPRPGSPANPPDRPAPRATAGPHRHRIADGLPQRAAPVIAADLGDPHRTVSDAARAEPASAIPLILSLRQRRAKVTGLGQRGGHRVGEHARIGQQRRQVETVCEHLPHHVG